MSWTSVDGERFATLVRHQEIVLNQRVTTLVLLNGLAFMALAMAWEGARELAPILAIAGAAGSAVLTPPIVAADAGLARLLKLWEKHCDPDDRTPIIGLPESFVWRLVWIAIPVLFVVVWAKVLMAVSDDSIFGSVESVKPMIKRFE